MVAACSSDTRLVSVMLANNETGVLFDVPQIARAVKRAFPGVLVHTDAAQAIGKISVDVEVLGVDYLTLVGHKFYGPRVGALYHRAGTPLVPMLFGGGQESGLRPGTENTPMIAGLGLAAEMASQNLDEESSHMMQCRNYLEEKLAETFGDKVVINCANSPRLPNTCNFAILLPNCRNVSVLKEVNFLASKGAACHSHNVAKPSQILLKSGVPHDVAMNSIRVSFGVNNTLEDAEFIVQELIRVTATLSRH